MGEHDSFFRGKRIDKNEWVEGYYVKSKFHWHKYGIHEDWIITSAFSNGGYFCVAGRYAVDPITVSRLIGKKDKNGKPIFENDLVKTKYGRICQVVWFEPKLCWDLKPVANLDRKPPYEWDLWYSENLEVVGNAFDNPEMIE